MVDDEDYPEAMRHSWAARHDKGKFVPYAQIPLSRLVMKAPKGVIIDHINNNPLDNRRVNLRLVTSQQNSFNRGPQRKNSLGGNGVHARYGKYRAVIRVDRKLIHLGIFKTIKEAAAAYNGAARIHFGEHAWLNPL